MHKNDIKTNNRFGTARHLKGKYKNSNSIFPFLSVQIIEKLHGNAKDIDEILVHRGKCYQSKLLLTFYGKKVCLTSNVLSVKEIEATVALAMLLYFVFLLFQGIYHDIILHIFEL